MNKYQIMTMLYAVEILKGNMSLENIANEIIRNKVSLLLEDKNNITVLLALEVLQGRETIDTLPLTLRESVQSILQESSYYKVLFESQILNNEISIDDVPTAIRDEISKSINEYL